MVTIKTRLPIPSLRPYVKMYFWGKDEESPLVQRIIAWSNGYCDFSHLYSDFRKICSYSPSRLLKESAHEEDAVGWRI